MPDVTIHDFRICDRVLAESDPDAGDVVFLGARGSIAYPFVVSRTLSGPSGLYIDAVDVVDADGRSLGTWEKKFEVDGESKPRRLVSELRGVRFPQPGIYTVQYSIFDDVVGNFAFNVLQETSPSAGIVPGPLDASLAKSTIVWIEMPTDRHPKRRSLFGRLAGRPDQPVPEYLSGQSWPVWYGYQDGRLYVLVGEDEQTVPGLTDASSVRVVARSKDKRSKVAETECAVEVLTKDAQWEALARDVLLGRRLNLRDGDAAVERWKKTCEIVALTPVPPALEDEIAG